MRLHSFDKFEYRVVASSIPNKKCVEVTFLYDGVLTKHYVFINKDSSNYIKDAKKIIDQEVKRGKLTRIAKKYFRGNVSTTIKPLLITLACIVGVSAISTGGYFLYKTLSTQQSGGGGDTPESSYTVTFMDGTTTLKELKNVTPGHIIEKNELPSKPEKEHYNFIGWCTDEAGKNIFEYSKIAIHQNYTLYSGWEYVDPSTSITITFMDSGVKYDDVEITKGEVIPSGEIPSDPTDPPEPGQTFIGWGSDTSGQYLLDLTKTKFYEGTTLYANWAGSTEIYKVFVINDDKTEVKEKKPYYNPGEKVSITISILETYVDEYVLSDDITVYIGGTPATKDVDYTYETGEDYLTATFEINSISNDVLITLNVNSVYMVTEMEFIEAILMQNEPFLQITFGEQEESEGEMKLSPSANMIHISETTDVEIYQYVAEDEKFMQTVNTGSGWEEEQEIESSEYITPYKFGYAILSQIAEFGLEYEDFVFSDETNEYIFADTTSSVKFKFKNKRLIKQEWVGYSAVVDTNSTFAYEEITPPDPRIP